MEQFRVLVIEDDPDIRISIGLTLESEGYDVLSAANGKEAFEALRGNGRLPDLIVLDLMMPVMDGWTFLSMQQEDAALSRIPVLVASAGTVPASGDLVGATRFIKKPFDIDAFLGTVKALVAPDGANSTQLLGASP